MKKSVTLLFIVVSRDFISRRFGHLYYVCGQTNNYIQALMISNAFRYNRIDNIASVYTGISLIYCYVRTHEFQKVRIFKVETGLITTPELIVFSYLLLLFEQFFHKARRVCTHTHLKLVYISQ